MAIAAAVHPRALPSRLSVLRGHTAHLQRQKALWACASAQHTLSQLKPAASHMVQDKITLTSEERALFDTLLAAAKFAGSNTVLRAAGGWVRDKLLGKESKDIDIALDNMLGREFADKVNEHLASQGRETHSAAVIHSNPDQSKHLETARMKIQALWVDLVNLRCETYADGSRIPKMEFGTPLQDAMRRDFTINSLFYNLNEDTVEDLTGQGMEDLRNGFLRTPLPPHETFMDDPLRVLRAVRFATRFGFTPDPAILAAAASDEVRLALGSKVSRERIGTELEGMFNGASPTAAVRLLHQLRLLPQVFTPPPQVSQLLGPDFGAPCVEVMAAAEELSQALQLELSPEDRRLLLLAALLLPLRQLGYAAKANKRVTASGYIIRESLKWRVKEVDGVAALHAHLADLAAVHQAVTGAGPGAGAPEASSEQDQVMLGRVIRQLKTHWKLGVVLVPLLQLPAAAPLGVEPAVSSEAAAAGADARSASPPAAAGSLRAGSGEQEQLQQRVDSVRALLAAAAGWGLEDCWQWKPLLDGKQLIELLSVPKGPLLGQLTAAVLEWQMAHPKGSREDCIEHIKACYVKLQAEAGSEPARGKK